jgi:hypothetical protein
MNPSKPRRAHANKSARQEWRAIWRRGPTIGKRVVCGARRRRDGRACKALSVPGKKRCKWHGGMSTGPITPEGIARVTANLHRAVRREPL